MRLVFIRHAPTNANLAGAMVKDYDSQSIKPISRAEISDWFCRIGWRIGPNFKLLCSPKLRCIQTAQALFGKNIEYGIVDELLDEFDCSGLGDKKFWEIDEAEFNSLVHLDKAEMEYKILDFITWVEKNYDKHDTVVVIAHGLYIRTLISMLQHSSDTPYELLNSTNIKFKNLDVLDIEDTSTVFQRSDGYVIYNYDQNVLQ